MNAGILTLEEFSAAIPRLGEILADAVADGAGVSFMKRISAEEGAAFWRGQIDGVAKGIKTVFVARDDDAIAGVVILEKAWQPNQPHRADVAKLLVHRDHRRKGAATLLMQALIARARSMDLKLITFDTVAGSPAETFYRGLGFTCAGYYPGYAYSLGGKLDDTALFYMKL